MGRKGNSGYTNPDVRFGNGDVGYSGSLGLTQHYLERLDGDLPPELSPAPGYVVWHRSDKLITQDGDGDVERWGDLSGNGINLNQTDADDRPDYTTSNAGLNSKPTVDTNGTAGSDEFMVGDDNALLDVNGTGGFCLYVVAEINNYPDSFNFFVSRLGSSSWNDGWGIYYYSGDFRFFVDYWNTSSKIIELTNPGVFNAPYIFKFLFNDDTNGDSSGMKAEIIGNSNSRSGTQPYNDPVDDSGISNGLWVNYAGGSTAWQGNWGMGEILFYNAPLDVGGQLTTEKYLKNRYNIT